MQTSQCKSSSHLLHPYPQIWNAWTRFWDGNSPSLHMITSMNVSTHQLRHAMNTGQMFTFARWFTAEGPAQCISGALYNLQSFHLSAHVAAQLWLVAVTSLAKITGTSVSKGCVPEHRCYPAAGGQALLNGLAAGLVFVPHWCMLGQWPGSW